MRKWFVVFYLLFSMFSPAEEEMEAEEERALMEQKLFPLLQEADRIVVYSLYPIDKQYLGPEPGEIEFLVAFKLPGENAAADMSKADRAVAKLARSGKSLLGRYPILGKATVSNPAEIQAFLKELRDSMRTFNEQGDRTAGCFYPRHSVLLVKGDRRLRFSICFECGKSYVDGVPGDESDTVHGFRHFAEPFEKLLNLKLDAVKAVRAPYDQHPPAGAK